MSAWERSKGSKVDKTVSILQRYLSLAREIPFPAEFSSNPNQTQLSVLIIVFRIIRKSQVNLITVGTKLFREVDLVCQI